MKKLNCIIIGIFAGIFLLMSCSKKDTLKSEELSTSVDEVTWIDAIARVSNPSNALFVENGSSIQQVIDEAEPGDIIYIEPGIYRELLSIKKANLTLVGTGMDINNMVVIENPDVAVKAFNVDAPSVDIRNIKVSHFEEQGADIGSLSTSLKGSKPLIKINRTALGGNIAHYTFDVVMGDTEYEIIRIHRVVKEYRKYFPVRTRGNIFMVHGAIQDFDDIFLTAGAEEINSSTSAPFYLAANNIDVWGIDLGWNTVPLEPEEGFDFMENWGVDRDIEHTINGLYLAQIVRAFTCQKYEKLNLLGFSYGVAIAYGAAGLEAKVHPHRRSIKGIIPVDSPLKSDDPIVQQANCEEAKNHLAFLEQGMYNYPWGVLNTIRFAGILFSE